MFLYTSDIHLGKGGNTDVAPLARLLKQAHIEGIPLVLGGDTFDKTADVVALAPAVKQILVAFPVVLYHVEGNHTVRSSYRELIPALLGSTPLDHNPVVIDGDWIVGADFQVTAAWEKTIDSVQGADCLVCHQTLGAFAPEYHACVKDRFIERFGMVLAGDWHYTAEYVNPVTGGIYLSAGPAVPILVESVKNKKYRFYTLY